MVPLLELGNTQGSRASALSYRHFATCFLFSYFGVFLSTGVRAE